MALLRDVDLIPIDILLKSKKSLEKKIVEQTKRGNLRGACRKKVHLDQVNAEIRRRENNKKI